MLAAVTCIVVGQLIFVAALQAREMWSSILGRGIYGLGGEVIGVLVNSVVTRQYSLVSPHVYIRSWADFESSDKGLSLAVAVLLCSSRLGSVSNSIVTPRLVESMGPFPSAFIVIAVSMGVVILSYLSLTPSLAVHKQSQAGFTFLASLRGFNSTFWLLIVVCAVGYGAINTFTNSAQRFLAAQFFDGDQITAGSQLRYDIQAVLHSLR